MKRVPEDSDYWSLEDKMVVTPIRSHFCFKTIKKNRFILQFSCSVMSDSLRPHESQHARPPCPSPTPRVHSNSRRSSR